MRALLYITAGDGSEPRAVFTSSERRIEQMPTKTRSDTHCTVYNPADDARRVSKVWQQAYFNAPHNMSHENKKKVADAAWQASKQQQE